MIKGTTENGGISERAQAAIAPAIAVLFPILIPTGHIIAFSYIFSQKEYKVDREKCNCSCWDTVFKGPYEDGVAKYKHIYFNATPNTFKIWALTVLAVIILYECFKTIIQLLKIYKLRYTMTLLFLLSLHSHYYAWWMHFNYWNDDFYAMWDHQVFYTLTELLCTSMAVLYLDRRKQLEPIPLIIIVNIGIFHVVHGSLDQFVKNVLMGVGSLHQVLRDIPLVLTDLIHIAIAGLELWRISRKHGRDFWGFLCTRQHLIVTASLTVLMQITILMLH